MKELLTTPPPIKKACRMLRVIVDAEPQPGAMNMAIDEVLLESALQKNLATLRVYRWSEPTVSLGYFQSKDDPILEERFPALARVRRLSGGGAILHHHEVTYSIAYPASHPYGDAPSRLYDAVHEGVVQMLNTIGVRAHLRGEASTDNPFLCFGRGDARDIVLGASKIMGSAQRRRRGAVLQHGSLLFKRSDHAPEFSGITDLAAISPDDLMAIPQRLVTAVVSSLSEQVAEATVTEEELAQARHFAASRYAGAAPFFQRSIAGAKK